MSEVKILSVDEILAATELEERIVEIPDLGGSVKIRAFNKGTQQHLRRLATDKRTGKINTDELECLIFVYGVIDPKFTPDQTKALRKVRASVLDKVIGEISEISGMSNEAVEEAEATFPGE